MLFETLLHNDNIVIKMRKLTFIQLLSNLHSQFIICYTNVLYSKRKIGFPGMGSSLGSHDAFRCLVSVISFKFLSIFHDLGIFEAYWQVNLLNVFYFWCISQFPMLRFSLCLFGSNSTEIMMWFFFFFQNIISKGKCYLLPIIASYQTIGENDVCEVPTL